MRNQRRGRRDLVHKRACYNYVCCVHDQGDKQIWEKLHVMYSNKTVTQGQFCTELGFSVMAIGMPLPAWTGACKPFFLCFTIE